MICRYCGSEFEPKKRGRKNGGFCCKHCADNWRQHNVYDLMPKKYTKTCAQCGAEFQTNNEKQTYCSNICRQAARRTGRTVYTKTCPYCGREFQTIHKNNKYCSSTCGSRDIGIKRRGEYFCEYCGKPRWSDHPNRNRFCSRECAYKMRILQSLPRKIEKEKQYVEAHRKVCPECGIEFQANRLNRIFCSDECRYKYDLRQDRESYAPITFTCAECGKIITTCYGDKRRIFCSDECRSTFSGRQYKRLHKDKEDKYKQKRKAQINAAFVENVDLWEVYDRDDGTCQICGLPVPADSTPDNEWAATVDHIVPLSVGGEHSNRNCQLAHRLCNSMKLDSGAEYSVDWEELLVNNPGRWNRRLDNLWKQLGWEPVIGDTRGNEAVEDSATA